MCYDQEKTQATRIADHIRRDFDREREAFAKQAEGGIAGCERSQTEILAELFSYHPPTPTTLPKFAAINQAAKNFAEVIL